MRLHVFDSVEQMIGADGLAAIVGGDVESVECSPLAAQHFSGNTLVRLHAKRNGQTARFVLKHFSIERDWIMRLTHDHAVREVALFRRGVYQRAPGVCFVPIVAAAREGRSWASLMVDVSDGLLPAGSEAVAVQDVNRCLDHLAAMHARFMEDPALLDPALGLCALPDFVTILSPPVARREIAQGRAHPVLAAARRGWEVFEAVALPQAVRIIRQTQQDPRPLLRAIARAPRTLVHGDFKFANLGSWPPPPEDGENPPGTAPEPRTIILDWQDAAFSAPLLDIGYFLALNSPRLPVSKDEAIQTYRDSLAAHGYPYPLQAWPRDLDLGLLAGGAMRLMWQKALGTQSDDPVERQRAGNEVSWWSEQIIRAGRWLEE